MSGGQGRDQTEFAQAYQRVGAEVIRIAETGAVRFSIAGHTDLTGKKEPGAVKVPGEIKIRRWRSE